MATKNQNKQTKRNIEFTISRKKDSDFNVGDYVIVQSQINMDGREITDYFEGAVISKRRRGENSSFVVSAIRSGVEVEKSFQTYSSSIMSIDVVEDIDEVQQLTAQISDISSNISSNLDKAITYIENSIEAIDRGRDVNS